MIKIKLECWWTNSGSLNQRMIKQFVSDEDLKSYTFVESNPDFTIVFGRTEWEKIETSKDRTFYFSQEPLWSPNEPKDIIHNYCSKILIADKRVYPDRDEYIETLLPMFYAGRGEYDHREEYDWSLKMKDKEYDKTNLISMVVRKDYCSYYDNLEKEGISKINYKLRTDLGIRLSEEIKDVDIFGTHWETNGSNVKGDIWNKHLSLDTYKFSIACENTIQKNYISEKFWDVILTDGIPLYLGCNNIKDYINDKDFIYLNDLSLDEMVDKINYLVNNGESFYQKNKQNILELKKRFFSDSNFSLWEKIKKLVNE